MILLKYIIKSFEWVLWQSRIFVLAIVISSIAAAIALIFLGSLDIYHTCIYLIHNFKLHKPVTSLTTHTLIQVINGIDLFMIATILLIFGIGIYELFISKIDNIEFDNRSGNILQVSSLNELKEKLLKVIHMVLIVLFFKYALKMDYKVMLNLLYLSIGILFIGASIYLTSRK